MRKFTCLMMLGVMSLQSSVFSLQREVTDRMRGGELELSSPKRMIEDCRRIMGEVTFDARGRARRSLATLGDTRDMRAYQVGENCAYGAAARMTALHNENRAYGAAVRMTALHNMKAGTVKTYGWIREKWTPEDTYNYTYDTSGNVTVELLKDAEGDYARTVSEYDENGMVKFKETKTSEDGVNYENNRKTEFEYDPILTDVITRRTEWMWMKGRDGNVDWQLVGNNYKRIITRDDEGNITSVVIAVLFDGEYDPTDRLTIMYDDGKAFEITEEVLDYDGKEYFWEQGAKMTDIVWERTNGQICDVENIFMGENRVKSARLIDEDGLEMAIEVEYPDPDSDAYTLTMTMTESGMTVNAVLTYTPLENGGGKIEQDITFMGMTIVHAEEELRYDEWGLVTLESHVEEGYGEVYSEGTRGEVEYDAEGKPTTYTVSQYYTDEDTGEEISEYLIRAEYSDYVDVTAGVGSLAAPSGSASERWYDLQGRRVLTPEKGKIAVRNGIKMLKVR